jgi:hypothetical protein
MASLAVGQIDFKINRYNSVLRKAINIIVFMELIFNQQNIVHTAVEEAFIWIHVVLMVLSFCTYGKFQ